ncbi:shikimate dehydrogenase, partial [Gemmatimonadota bacterium]
LHLVARGKQRLIDLAAEITEQSGLRPIISDHLSEVLPLSDIVISATSSGGQIVQAKDLKAGSIVCDVAVPYDISRDVAESRPDVLVIEGGLVQVPGEIDLGFDIGYPPGVVLACMAETIILCLEGICEHSSIGRNISLAEVERMKDLADKHGFKLAGFRSFDRAVTDEQIERVRASASTASRAQ